ncbi:HPr family phosphocarrier protein [Rummeliibacillus sp. G93]|uniref:HPr family phosphocarrier protein n=1 Tax=Rummeliibacillus TaxID=648802 RepID=UPI00116F7FAE|nr:MULTISPECIES: HPr family phosphocarrier protein [Rummeliibacillus]MBB5171019.1 catabolite repression HPr-like protein [Rummeliibacillus stabekisii]UQW96704.1 HPr family phosphocarrier protein [Rummeliibacillus sp. G93]GEL05326.1 HPr-like protein Crh [Rummeliibacillus stabekisii]
MVEQQAKVNLKSGLQARQAALFVQEANRHAADIFLQKDDKKVNAKSIMGIMSLALAHGTPVILSASGDDEDQALSNLIQLIEVEE